jgi:hypothetical protein
MVLCRGDRRGQIVEPELSQARQKRREPLPAKDAADELGRRGAAALNDRAQDRAGEPRLIKPCDGLLAIAH